MNQNKQTNKKEWNNNTHPKTIGIHECKTQNLAKSSFRNTQTKNIIIIFLLIYLNRCKTKYISNYFKAYLIIYQAYECARKSSLKLNFITFTMIFSTILTNRSSVGHFHRFYSFGNINDIAGLSTALGTFFHFFFCSLKFKHNTDHKFIIIFQISICFESVKFDVQNVECNFWC